MTTGIDFKQMPGQIKVDEAEGIVECFVAGIGNKDSVGDICAPGAFNASLRRRTPRVVWGHDWNQPIGKVLEIYEVGANDQRLPKKMKEAGIGGLYARVQFNLKSERGREAFASISFFGMDQEWSIGYKTLDAVFDNARQANILKEVELYEVSPVLHGANQLTGTISIKSDTALLDQPEVKRDKPLKDPKGGLTAAGREYFKRTEGANLKPGVKGPADTPEKMRRKGSFLTRFFTNPSGPLVGDNGKPTRLALSAAAWGEPIPKNAEDAAELAAKGRRLLERYKNQKKKDAKGHGYEGDGDEDDIKPKAGEGFMKMLARAIANEMDAPVKIRTADDNMVIFDLMRDGEKQTFRMGYHFDDGDFMFGRSEQVKPETVYMPVGEAGPGHSFSGDEKSADDITSWLDDMIDFASSEDEFGLKVDEEAVAAIAELVSTEIEVKVGRVLSGSNLEKLNQAINILREIAATGGRETIEMKTPEELIIPSEQKNLFALRLHLDPVFDHYGASVECHENGIVVKAISGNSQKFKAAVDRAIRGFDSPLVDSEGIEEKAAFRRGRRAISGGGGGGRGLGRVRRMGDKPSYDGDNDGFITNPLTGRDEIPWSKDRETPEEAISRFFSGKKPQSGLGQAIGQMADKPSKRPQKLREVIARKPPRTERLSPVSDLQVGDILPDNFDDESKPLGSPKWQINRATKKGTTIEFELADLETGNRRMFTLNEGASVPEVVRPKPTDASRGGDRLSLEPIYKPDGRILAPFDPNRKKPGSRPKTPPRATQRFIPGQDTGREAPLDDIPGMTDAELEATVNQANRNYPLNGDVTTPRIERERAEAAKREQARRRRGGQQRLPGFEKEKKPKTLDDMIKDWSWPLDSNGQPKKFEEMTDQEINQAQLVLNSRENRSDSDNRMLKALLQEMMDRYYEREQDDLEWDEQQRREEEGPDLSEMTDRELSQYESDLLDKKPRTSTIENRLSRVMDEIDRRAEEADRREADANAENEYDQRMLDKPMPGPNAPRPEPFNWPKNERNQVKEVQELTDEELSAAITYWSKVPFNEQNSPGIRNLINALIDENARRREERNKPMERPQGLIDRFLSKLNWRGAGRESPAGNRSVESARTENGRYWIIEADDFGMTPGKFMVEFEYRRWNGDTGYDDQSPEFDTIEQAQEWIEKLEKELEDGGDPEDDDFNWPDAPASQEEVAEAVSTGRTWEVRVPNKPAKGKNGPLGSKERSHNFIPAALDDARSLFAEKWADRRRTQNIDENIEAARDRINELEILRERAENAYINNFPGFEEGYSMSAGEYAREAVRQGWVDTIGEGLLLHEELMDAWDQLGNDLTEIDGMIGSVQEDLDSFIDKANQKYEAGNPDFPEEYRR